MLLRTGNHISELLVKEERQVLLRNLEETLCILHFATTHLSKYFAPEGLQSFYIFKLPLNGTYGLPRTRLQILLSVTLSKSEF